MTPRPVLSALALVLAFALAFPAPAAAIEFDGSKFRRAVGYAQSMVRAWEKGRVAAKASGFFLANRQRRLLVMTGTHVVGRHPVFEYRGIRATSVKRVLRDDDIAIFEVDFAGRVAYSAVGTFHIAATRPALGAPLMTVGYPKGFSGALMMSGGCALLPRNRLLHPSYFSCTDLDRWCAYAEKAEKSRATCRADAKDAARGRVRQCSLPLDERYTRPERHRQSTHAMSCAVRLGSSGGPVLLATSRRSRSVVGMPSAVFARVRGPFPDNLGVGVAIFGQSFKARAKRLGIAVR